MTRLRPGQTAGHTDPLRRSPNVLSIGDVVRVCHPWASCSFMARVVGFPGEGVRVEAVEPSDDPMVENSWTVPYASIGPRGPMDDRYFPGCEPE